MLVVYRACPFGNPNKKRPIEGDKTLLVEVCFGSFLYAFQDVDMELVVLLDKPTNTIRKLFDSPWVSRVEETRYPDLDSGNIGSFHRQIDIALEKKTDFLFVEDDYEFAPEAGKIIESALKDLTFLTPYDHPGYYTEDIHQYKKEIKLSGGRHWYTTISTTLTFGGQYQALKEEADTMKKYGWADHNMWCDVTQRKKLWGPIPSLATHMEVGLFPPNSEWKLQTP